MYKSSGNVRQASLFWDLESMLDSKHPLYKLANLVDWDMFEKSDSLYVRTKKHELFRKRAGIEPVIGHCKSDHRLSRNFYKGLFGGSINVMLAAAAFNFKRAMRVLLCLIERLAIIRIWDQMRLNKQSLCPAISPCVYHAREGVFMRDD